MKERPRKVIAAVAVGIAAYKLSTMGFLKREPEKRVVEPSPDPDVPSRSEELAGLLNQRRHQKADEKPWNAEEVSQQRQENKEKEQRHRKSRRDDD